MSQLWRNVYIVTVVLITFLAVVILLGEDQTRRLNEAVEQCENRELSNAEFLECLHAQNLVLKFR